MKKFRILSFALLMALLLSMFSGCQLFGSGDQAKAAIKEAFDNMYDVKALTFDVKLGGTAKDNSPLDLKFDTAMSGILDGLDPKVPKLDLKLSGSGVYNGGSEQSLDLEVRVDKDNAYFIVNNVSDFDGMIPAEMVAPYLKQWWSMPIPAGTFDQVSGLTEDESKMTPEEKAMKQLLKDTEFFTDVKLEGNDGGMDHYSGVLDKEALKDFTVKSAEISKQPLTDIDLKDFDQSMDNLKTASFEIWVDPVKKLVSKMSGTLEISEAASEAEGKFTFEATLDKFNEAVTIEVPAGAVPFDLGAFLGAPAL